MKKENLFVTDEAKTNVSMESTNFSDIKAKLIKAGAWFSDQDINFIVSHICEEEWNPSVNDCKAFLSDCKVNGLTYTMLEYQLVNLQEAADRLGVDMDFFQR